MMQINARIREDQNDKLNKIKKEDGRARTETIRIALDEHFKKHNIK